MDTNKAVLEALVKGKARQPDHIRQEFIGGAKLDLSGKTLTTADGRYQLALLESGDVFLRRKAS